MPARRRYLTAVDETAALVIGRHGATARKNTCRSEVSRRAFFR